MMNILIVGGTSGIGWALAEHYLLAGHRVAACGRDTSKIHPDIAKKYSQLNLYFFDIANKAAVVAAIDEFTTDHLDLVIVSAGFYFNTRHSVLDEATTLRMLQTNVSGLNHVFEHCASIMLEQKSGHLVAISSMAGLLKNHAGASLYSASKRNVLSLCDTYRNALAPFSIAVTAIIPGYVNTEKLRYLNGGDASHKPFLLSVQQASDKIIAAIEKRQSICAFPWQMKVLITLLNLLPKKILALRP